MLQELKARCVKPLEVVEKERKRMFARGKNPKKPPKDHLKSTCCVPSRKFQTRRLRANDSFKLRYDIYDYLPVLTQRLQEFVAPNTQLQFRLAENLTQKALERLGERCIGNFPLVQVELASREKPTRRNQNLMQLIDDRRFSDSRVPRHEH